MTEPHRVEPLTVAEVAALFKSADFPWWIAGGWGLDLFLGHQTRPHEDTDVLVLRRDQRRLQAHLEGWELHAADPPGTGSLRPWTAEEQLDLPVHQVWCRKEPTRPWQLEIVLGETTNGQWAFRRNPNITRPLELLGATTDAGIPYVAPEVLLLFKAKHLRPKDNLDFEAVASKLQPDSREWLFTAIEHTYPGHPWLASL